MANTDENYQDGTYSICEKCSVNKKYTREYWNKWRKGRVQE